MIIFLDFDGVIATSESYKQANGVREERLYKPAIKTLQKLASQLKAKIVISSAWRHLFELESLKDWLKIAGLKAKVIGITPTVWKGCTGARGLEILAWMKSKNYTGDYLVIDDEMTLLEEFIPSEKIIHCKNGWRGNGLTEKLVKEYLKRRKHINVFQDSE